MIRVAAKEKSNPVFGSILDPLKIRETRKGQETSRPVRRRLAALQVQPRSLAVLNKLAGVNLIQMVQVKALLHD